jgi:hypothetical protein
VNTGLNDREWLHAAPTYLPVNEPATVTLTVDAAIDHPSAVLAARLSPALVALLRHFDELAELTPAECAYALADLGQLGRVVRGLEEHMIVIARENGASWAELGTMLGVTRATAKERYERIKAANARTLTAEAAAAETAAPGRATVTVGHAGGVESVTLPTLEAEALDRLVNDAMTSGGTVRVGGTTISGAAILHVSLTFDQD